MRYFIGSSCDDRVGSGTILKFAQDEVKSIERCTEVPGETMFPTYAITDANRFTVWYLRDLMVVETDSYGRLETIDISEIQDLNTLL